MKMICLTPIFRGGSIPGDPLIILLAGLRPALKEGSTTRTPRAPARTASPAPLLYEWMPAFSIDAYGSPHRRLCDDPCAEASADGEAPLADAKLDPFFHGHRLEQFHGYLNGLSRHDHFYTLRHSARSRHVGPA